ncbi:hypothetical protein CI793_07315 [Anoxybacillus ayderensis]|uniref:hypothetical protein n=1 Tax=Anoxybacillus sp. ST70 TaxID=2864180 RepID=UPI00037ADA6C|nr:hypothetical protein [Anoxybacillus sp. ST70]AXM89422.1 hypothetical protein B379_09930 [Anoxybacillus ayderensis G10]MBW9217550.1 hypothetical protein [Anoxybacillus sp. ST70]THD16786.1 hypothetical protein CI793_07315 [Anoxybacillus ayderensis]
MKNLCLFFLSFILVFTFPVSSLAQKPQADDSDCIVCGDATYKVTKISGPSLVTEKFQTYLTSAWAYSDRYVWTETTTTTLQITGGATFDITEAIKNQLNLSWSKSKSYSVAIQIPADKNKYSKLGLFGDFNKYYVKVVKDKFGQETISYHDAYEPTSTHYLKVVYKN